MQRIWCTRYVAVGTNIESCFDFYILSRIQTGTLTHPAAYSTGNGSYLPGGEVAGASSYHVLSSSVEVKCVEQWLHSTICLHDIPRVSITFIYFIRVCAIKCYYRRVNMLPAHMTQVISVPSHSTLFY